MLDTHARKNVQPGIDYLADILIKHHLKPTDITIISLIIGLISIVAILNQHFIIAVLLLWLSGLFDALDGTVARKTKATSQLGAFLDICFDRIVEVGIIISLVIIQPELGTMLVILTTTIVLSLTIFLTVSSFAQNNGKKAFYYQAGLAERSEGFVFFTLMILLVNYRTIIGYLFAITVLITAIQRFYEGIKILNTLKRKEKF